MKTEPVELQFIDLGTSQRIDVKICTTQDTAVYRMKVVTSWRGSSTGYDGLFDQIFLRYDDSTEMSAEEPKTEGKYPDDQFSMIKPLVKEDIPEATRTITYDIAQQWVDKTTSIGLDVTGVNRNGNLKWTMNNVAHVLGSTALLLASYYDKLYGPDSVVTALATKPTYIELNEVVDIVLQNRAATNGRCEAHPW